MSRMLSALRCLCQVRLPPWDEGFEGRKPSYHYRENMRRILLGDPEEARTAAVELARVAAGSESAEQILDRLVREQSWCSALTSSQRTAVQRAIDETLSLIQGPPGTGKTYVACAIIAAWVTRYGPLGERILAVADSNVAADNLHTRLQSFGVESVRVGQGKGVETMSGDSLWQAVKSAQVVIATCIGSGMEVLDSKADAGQFARVVIDECTQACEPAAIVALGRGCEQAVLIGDHAQLPATVLSQLAKRDGLGVSLFERMVNINGLSPTVLQEQRRMHSSIAEFPNQTFYSSQLVNAVDDSSLPAVPGFSWPNPECRVCFVDVLADAEGKRGFSAFNVPEAEAIAEVVRNILDSGFDASSLCILTAYQAQRAEILRALRDKGLGAHLHLLSVDTVDGYQGMEQDLVLFSATRSNAERSLGFLADARRMNVMLTRAKRGLIVFGNGDTLRNSPAVESHWRTWLEWVESRGSVLSSAALHPHGGLAADMPAVAESSSRTNNSLENWPSSGHVDEVANVAAVPLGSGLAEGWMPPPPPPVSAQPDSSWEKVYSEQYAAYYYWDRVSNRTQWELPAELDK